MGGGYNAARVVISRDIADKLILVNYTHMDYQCSYVLIVYYILYRENNKRNIIFLKTDKLFNILRCRV